MPCDREAVTIGELETDLAKEVMGSAGTAPNNLEAARLMITEVLIEEKVLPANSNGGKFYDFYQGRAQEYRVETVSPTGARFNGFSCEIGQGGKLKFGYTGNLARDKALQGRLETKITECLTDLGIAIAQEKAVDAVKKVAKKIVSDTYDRSGARVVKFKI